MALTQYYVDPSIAASSGTGTIGDPFGDLQYGLNTVTRDSTNGDQFNIKAGTAEVLGAALTLATYGTPTYSAPLVLRGYTSVAGDGGVGAISGAGSYAILSETGKDFIHLADLRLYNTGSATPVSLRDYCTIANCQVDTSTANQFLFLRRYCEVVGCYLTGAVVVRAIYIGRGAVLNNKMHLTGCSCGIHFYEGDNKSVAIGNAIHVSGSVGSSGAIYSSAAGGLLVVGNSILYTGSGTDRYGIYWSPTAAGRMFAAWNNIVAGYATTSSIGLYSTGEVVLLGSNAFYNNTTNESLASGPFFRVSSNVALGALPWTDAANGDWSLTAAGITALAGLGYPVNLYPSGTATNLTIGAIQQAAGSGSGGGGPVRILPLRGILG